MFKSKYILGLDLGQQNDYTVLTAREVVHSNARGIGMLYKLVFLKKFRLKESYPSVINTIIYLIDKLFDNRNYILIVDYTGVGRIVVDLLRESDVKLIALSITGGHFVSWKSGSEVSVPKKDLVSAMQVIFSNYRIKISENLDHLEDLKKELVNFRPKKPTSTGHTKFEGLSGHHDDIVMSLGIALWYGEHASGRGRRLRIISGN